MEYSKSEQDLIEFANRAIGELVYDKVDLLKAYNYYHGRRDEKLFKYLEDNYGIGNASAVQFTPLIKKHVDALIGEYLGTPILPRVSCKDSDTICNMQREKELSISAEVYKMLQSRLQNRILEYFQTDDQNKLQDPSIQNQLDRLIDDLDNNFISKYEIAAQNVIQYVMQCRQTDMHTKLRQLFLDLLVTGYTFYRVVETADKSNIAIEVLNPLDTFFDKNYNSPYIKDSYRTVVRRWLTKTEILNKYGDSLSREDKELIDASIGQNRYSTKYVRASRSIGQSDGIVANTEVQVNGHPRKNNQLNSELIPVYEVEWTETDKDFIMQRYSVIRIGEEIFIVNGKDEHVQRSINNPNYCSLTLNGVYFDNRTDEPFSLVKSCMHLQDNYDLLLFYRDNILANSGTIGDWIDQSLIPADLGKDWVERLQRWIAYKKQGIGLLDTAQEGRLSTGQAQLNTIFNGFDDTVKAPAIQAIQVAIESIEQTMSSITGVFRERLNGIEQRDAVTNVKVGQNNSFIVTKHWFLQMDVTVEELLTDVLNKAKIVYKNGLTGTIVLGEKQQKIFTALPKYFTVSDFDVHVLANSNIVQDTELLKLIVPEFVKMQAISPDVILDVLDTKSLSEAKHRVKSALKKQKEENNMMQQLQEKLQEAEQQLQDLQKNLEQSTKDNESLEKQVEKLSKEKLDIEREKIDTDAKIRWYEAQTNRQYYQSKARNDDKRTDIEEEQLYDGNPYNDEVKNM